MLFGNTALGMDLTCCSMNLTRTMDSSTGLPRDPTSAESGGRAGEELKGSALTSMTLPHPLAPES